MPPWFKFWTEKLLTLDFFLLSPNARSVLVYALVVTHNAKEHGGPVTVADLQAVTSLPIAKVRLAVTELRFRRLLDGDGDTVLCPLYDEMQERVDRTRASRQAAWRQKRDAQRNADLDASCNALSNAESNAEKRYEKKARGEEDKIPSPPPVATQPTAPTGGGVPRRREPSQTGLLDPDWLIGLRAQVTALQGRDVTTLSADERFLVARYHAAVFGHCRKSEQTNKSRAGGVATSLQSLTEWVDRSLDGMTVQQYFAYGKRHHERIGRGVWLRPWDLKASLETA